MECPYRAEIIQATALRNEGGWFTVKGSGFMVKDDGRMNNLGIFWSGVGLYNFLKWCILEHPLEKDAMVF